MRYVAAYLLAVLGGNSDPSKEDIGKILESVGLDVDGERLSKVGCGLMLGWLSMDIGPSIVQLW